MLFFINYIFRSSEESASHFFIINVLILFACVLVLDFYSTVPAQYWLFKYILSIFLMQALTKIVSLSSVILIKFLNILLVDIVS